MTEKISAERHDTGSPTTAAGLGSRFLARFLDAVLVGIFISISLAVIGLPAPTIGLGGTEAWGQSAATALLWFAYYVVAESFTGTTVGKRLAKLRVVGDDANKPSLVAAAIRNIWIFFGLIPLLGGLILVVAVVIIAVTIARNEDNRGVHDLVADTSVVA